MLRPPAAFFTSRRAVRRHRCRARPCSRTSAILAYFEDVSFLMKPSNKRSSIMPRSPIGCPARLPRTTLADRRGQHRFGVAQRPFEHAEKPGEPLGDVQIVLLRGFQSRVVGGALDRERRRHAVESSPGLPSGRVPDRRWLDQLPVPVVKRMDRFERDARDGRSETWIGLLRSDPRTKPGSAPFPSHAVGWWPLKTNLLLAGAPRHDLHGPARIAAPGADGGDRIEASHWSEAVSDVTGSGAER